MTISIPTHGQHLNPVIDESDGTYDLFLPAYTTREQLQITVPWGTKLSISDGVSNYGSSLADVPLRTELEFRLKTWFGTESYHLQLWQNTNLPTMYIEAESGVMDFIHENIEHKKEVMVNMIDAQGERILSQTAAISGRGNGSWENDKRPYNLKFSAPTAVFGNIDRLCLLAEFSDGSKLRNALGYYAAQELEHTYTSDYQYCNLYVNGEYLGLYGITTKQEYEEHILSDGIQAVFEYTTYEKGNHFYTFPALQPFRVVYGDVHWVKELLDVFTSALQEQNWEVCAQMADLESIASKMVLEEFLGNYDMTFGSQYYYVDENDIIHAMLPWDYDWSLGNAVVYQNLVSEYQIMSYRNEFWYSQLLEYEPFRQMAVEELESRYTDTFFQSLRNYLHDTGAQISDSRDSDAQRWRNADSKNHWEARKGADSIQKAIAQFESYFLERREFLLAYYKEPGNYHRVEFVHDIFLDDMNMYSNIMVEKGTNLQPYLISDFLDARGYFGNSYLCWDAEGISPWDVGEVNRDYTFSLLVDESAQPQVESVPQENPDKAKNWMVTIICAGVVLTALLLVGAEGKHLLSRRKDKVAV